MLHTVQLWTVLSRLPTISAAVTQQLAATQRLESDTDAALPEVPYLDAQRISLMGIG